MACETCFTANMLSILIELTVGTVHVVCQLLFVVIRIFLVDSAHSNYIYITQFSNQLLQTCDN